MRSENQEMIMNPLAKELNECLQKENPHVLDMLSSLGKQLFFPKGILSQTAEAREKAGKYNATIGMAREKGQAMHLACLMKNISGLKPDQVLTYAPAGGLQDLREKWKEELFEKNPSLSGKSTSTPLVTAGITHGLALVGEMFVDPGDILVLPDKMWGNYRMIFEVRKSATIKTYPLFAESGRFNVDGLYSSLVEVGEKKEKAIVILNFPNNPTGYSPTWEEGQEIAGALTRVTEEGLDVVLVSDDSYYGLFYEEEVMRESIFGLVSDSSERILSVKLDGATKEDYAWGLRTGFITFNAVARTDKEALYDVMEKKTTGCIRGTISNAPHVSQSLILEAKRDPGYAGERKEKYRIMRDRATTVKKVLSREKYEDTWEPYPFNSGYFMCLRLKGIDAEDFRKKLLADHGIGIIAMGSSDIRVAFSCIEVDQIEDLFETMFSCAIEMTG